MKCWRLRQRIDTVMLIESAAKATFDVNQRRRKKNSKEQITKMKFKYETRYDNNDDVYACGSERTRDQYRTRS